MCSFPLEIHDTINSNLLLAGIVILLLLDFLIAGCLYVLDKLMSIFFPIGTSVNLKGDIKGSGKQASQMQHAC